MEPTRGNSSIVASGVYSRGCGSSASMLRDATLNTTLTLHATTTTSSTPARRVRTVVDELSTNASYRAASLANRNQYGRRKSVPHLHDRSSATHTEPMDAHRLAAAQHVLEQVEINDARTHYASSYGGHRSCTAPLHPSDTSASDDDGGCFDRCYGGDGGCFDQVAASVHVGPVARRSDHHVVDVVRRRRAERFETTMVHRLDAFIANDERRCAAKAAFVEQSLEARRKQWARVFAHACFTNMLSHHLILRRAYEVLKQKFLYKYLRHVRKKRSIQLRAQRLRERQAMMLAPPPKEILRAQLSIFQKLPDATIDALTAAMTKKCLFAGEFLAYEGEPGECVSILHAGSLRVSRRGAPGGNGRGGAVDAQTPVEIPRTRGGSVSATLSSSIGKPLQMQQRTASASALSPNSAQTTTSQRGSSRAAVTPQTCLTPDKVNSYGWAVGQTMLFAVEPYEYTFRAAVDCDLWVLSGTQFVEIVAATMAAMPRQLEVVNRVLDERRAFNMAQLRCMTEPALRASSPLFQNLSSHGIRKILSVLRPLVVRKGDVVVAPGRYGLDIVFVVGGKVDVCAGVERRSAVLDVARVGMCVGEVAALLDKRLDSKTIVRATSTAELWVLGASDLQAVIIHEDTRAVMAAALALVDEHGNERPLRTRHNVPLTVPGGDMAS